MRSRSPANRADSAPPSPALISRMTSLSSSGSSGSSRERSRSSSSGTRCSSAAASAAKEASSSASSRAAARSSRTASSARLVSTSGASCAYRRPSRRARDASAWTAGSASSVSSAACSASSPLSRSGAASVLLLMGTSQTAAVSAGTAGRTGLDTTTAPAPHEVGRAPSGGLLAGVGVALAEPLLEAGHAAAGVQDPLLARVEGVAGGAGLDGQRAAGGRAAGGEGVPATTGHRGGVVVGVDAGLHVASSGGLCRSGGRTPAAGRSFRPRSGARSLSIPDAGDVLAARCWNGPAAGPHREPASGGGQRGPSLVAGAERRLLDLHEELDVVARLAQLVEQQDRKSTRLNSSHANISYAVFCLKKKRYIETSSTLCSRRLAQSLSRRAYDSI